jgi:hypothetical protein
VIPVAYGDGVADQIRAAAPGGVDAFIDTDGDGYVDAAVAESRLFASWRRVDAEAAQVLASSKPVRHEDDVAAGQLVSGQQGLDPVTTCPGA